MPRPDMLWAITSYFNPMQYQRRRANYRLFRKYLRVPLVAVELSYGPDFELTGFLLQPVGFFDRNPALDLPPPSTHCGD